ncbi:FHA domain-containing protein, partial [Streptomyces parvulus]|nr:FHA domain-containing protein [Streptomyces parvulus]
MPTCPNGHQSGSDDWCEVCGHRMAGAVPPPPPPPAPGGGYGFPPPAGPGGPGGEPQLCPQCRTPREGGAPFCEECRWNFLTNTATSYTPAAPRPPASGGPAPFQQPPGGPSYGGGDAYGYQGSRPSQMNRPAEPIPPGP